MAVSKSTRQGRQILHEPERRQERPEPESQADQEGDQEKHEDQLHALHPQKQLHTRLPHEVQRPSGRQSADGPPDGQRGRKSHRAEALSGPPPFKSRTTVKQLMTVTKIVTRGELSKHATVEGMKSCAKLTASY